MQQKNNGAILSRSALLIWSTFLSSILYTSTAFAEPKITEVQPMPIDSPTQLVIYGADFGPIVTDAEVPEPEPQAPMFHFGTDQELLNIPEDQSLCDFPADDGQPAPAGHRRLPWRE